MTSTPSTPRKDTAGSFPPGPRPVRRRTLLAAGVGAMLLAGCDLPDAGTRGVTPPPQVGGPWTVADLTSEQPFYIAHRGSYDNWVEHTMDAYSQAAASGAKALEVSVNATSDGVLVCHHDKDTGRLSDRDLTISATTYDELRAVLIDQRAWLGPSAVPQPIPRLADVLDTFAGSHVIFIEDKQGTNTIQLLDLLDTYANAREHFVWKQWAGSNQYREALARGYTRWGYFTPEILDRLDELAPRFDLLGIPVSATDADTERFVASGKPVIAWEVHARHERARLEELGVAGIMCSNIPYVRASSPISASDDFQSGRRAPGDLPWTTTRGASYQPAFDVLNAALTIDRQGVQSYCMGSMGPVTSPSYSLVFQIRWPADLPEGVQHAGLAFGQADDRPYRVRVASEVAGYHLVLRPKGVLELFSREAGTVDGTRIGGVTTRPIESEQWVEIEVLVTPETITVRRKGLDTWSFDVDDAQYRGGYFSLCKNYAEGPAVQFRSVAIT